MSQPPTQSRLVSKLRHEIATMPFDPADLVFAQLALPPRCRFGADFGETNAGGRIPCPQTTNLCRVKSDIGIKRDLEIITDSLHDGGGLTDEFFIGNNKAGDLTLTHLIG